MEEKVACLENVDGRTHLCRTYQYYYQVQTQVFVCNVVYSGMNQMRDRVNTSPVPVLLSSICKS